MVGEGTNRKVPSTLPLPKTHSLILMTIKNTSLVQLTRIRKYQQTLPMDPVTHSVNTLTADEWVLPIERNGSIIPCNIDTSARVSILSKTLSKTDYQHPNQKSTLHKSAFGLTAYCDEALFEYM